MKKKIVWLVVSCLMALSLVLASCAPAVTEEEEEEEVVEEEVVTEEKVVTEEEVVAPEVEMVRDALGKLVEKPKYGGTVMTALKADPTGTDDVHVGGAYGSPTHLIGDTILTGDWAKGQAGTGETAWRLTGSLRLQQSRGAVIESWEYLDIYTLVFHIRQGVYFHDKPPANGRQMTAEDVAFNIRRWCEDPRAYLRATLGKWFESATVTDTWTVVVKGKEDSTALLPAFLDYHTVVAPEAIEEYGDVRDWRVTCSTGAFEIEDVVAAASWTFKKHPNYWMEDPLLPGNRLPYVDKVVWLIIPDVSTQLAALRTGKIDMLYPIPKVDRDALVKANPKLQYSKSLGTVNLLFGRIDREELPFNDIRVRQALTLAIDQPGITKDYYGGEAEIIAWPIPPDFKADYVPLDELPEATRELFSHNPDKARQLLAEAGYPDGFETSLVCIAPVVDLISIIKANWADIGVDVHLEVKERAVYMSIRNGGSHEAMIYSTTGAGNADRYLQFVPGRVTNLAIVDDPYINERFAGVWSFENFANPAKRTELNHEIVNHILWQCYV